MRTAQAPPATRRAMVAVALVVMAVCSLVEPAAAVGVAGGVAAATAVFGLSSSTGRAFLSGALLPAAGSGAVVGIFVLGGSAAAVAVGFCGLVAGMCLVALLSEPDPQAGKLVVTGLLLATIVGFGAAASALVLVDGSGIPDAETVESGTTYGELLGSTAIAAGAVVGAVVAAPLTLYGSTEASARARRRWLIGGIAAVFAGGWLLVQLTAIWELVPGLAGAVESGLVSYRFQLAIMSLAFVGAWVAFLGVLTRMAWYTSGEHSVARNPAVGTLAGLTVGFTTVGGAYVVGVTGRGLETEVALSTLLAGVTLAFGGCYIAVIQLSAATDRTGALAAGGLALTLALAGVSLGASVDGGPGAVATPSGLVSLVAVAGGVFVYVAARRGIALTREVTAAGTTRRAQLVTLGWVGALAVAGVVVAVVGLGIGAVLTPALSATASAAVLLGLVALVAVGFSLLR